MSQQPRLELFRTTWRPTLMWWLLLTVAVPFGLVVSALLLAYAYAVWKAVLTSTPVPNLLGGIEALPWPYIIPGLGALFGGYIVRSREVISGGAHNARPFEPSHTPGTPPEPSSGGIINQNGLDQQ